MTTLLERFLGANWRTTLTGVGTAIFSVLAALAAAPYELGELATIIPPHWKAKLFAISAGATFILRLVNAHVAKDATVSGGSVINVLPGPVRLVEGSREGIMERAGKSKLVGQDDSGSVDWLFIAVLSLVCGAMVVAFALLLQVCFPSA